MKHRILSGVVALALAASLAACGSTDSSASGGAGPNKGESSTSTLMAGDVLKKEVNKLSGDALSANGSIQLAANIDFGDTDEKLTLSNISGIQGSSKMDMEFNLDVAWKGEDAFTMDLGLADKEITKLAYDGENYFIDLSILPEFAKLGGGDTDALNKDIGNGTKMSDIFSLIKVPKSEFDELKGNVEKSAGTSLNTDAFKNGLESSVISEIEKLSDRAEYDGNSIVIKDMDPKDLKPLLNAVSEQLKNATGSSNLQNMFGNKLDIASPDSALDSEATDSSDTDNTEKSTITYKLDYSDGEKIAQTHTFEINHGNDKATISIKLDNNSDISFDSFSDAKTIEELTDNALSFKTLVSSFLNGMGKAVVNEDSEYTDPYNYDGTDDNNDMDDMDIVDDLPVDVVE